MCFQAALLQVVEDFPLINIELNVADTLSDLQQAQIDIAVRRYATPSAIGKSSGGAFVFAK